MVLVLAIIIQASSVQAGDTPTGVQPARSDVKLNDNSLEQKSGFKKFDPRLVVTGLDGHGRSSFVYDGAGKYTQFLPNSTLVTLWQVAKIPAPMMAESGEVDLQKFMPPPAGFRAVIVELRPDSALGDEAAQRRAFAKVLDEVGESQAERGAGPPGMHQTESCELITVISGEVYVVLETGEKLLRAGDTLIQRGTSHAWSNRSKTPVVFLYVVWPALR